jgi:DNA-binding SARP family transcriptional activator
LSSRNLTVSRQKLCSVFWPEADHDQAATNLRQSLARVRRFQEEHDIRLIESNFTVVHLHPEQFRWDLAEVVRAIDGDSDIFDIDAVTTLCAHYGGDLLSDIAQSSFEFEDWLSEQRAQLREGVIEKLVVALEEPDRFPQTLRMACARKLLTIDKSNEQAFHLLMREAAEHRDFGRLRQIYERYERHMRDELGVSGSPHTRALYAELLLGEH